MQRIYQRIDLKVDDMVGRIHLLEMERDLLQKQIEVVQKICCKLIQRITDLDENILNKKKSDNVNYDDFCKTLSVQYKQLIAKKNEELSIINHEIRNHLNSIVGFTDFLMIIGMQNQYLSHIKHSCALLLRFSEDLGFIAQIEHGSIVMNNERINVLELVSCCKNYLLAQSVRDLQINVYSQNGLYLLLADKLRIQQIIINVLSNAIKFSEKQIDIHIGNINDFIYISIKDHGIGLSIDDLNRIGEQYVRINSDIMGMGLGLFIVKKFMELHGGSVEIESIVDRGTLVRLIFPPYRTLKCPNISIEILT